MHYFFGCATWLKCKENRRIYANVVPQGTSKCNPPLKSEASGIKRLREFEDENRKLKLMVGDLSP